MQTLPSSFNSESTETGLLWGNGWGSGRSYGCRWPAGTWPVSYAWDPLAPPPASSQGKGGLVKFVKAIPAACWAAGWGILL